MTVTVQMVRVLNRLGYEAPMNPFSVSVDGVACVSNEAATPGWNAAACGATGSTLRVFKDGPITICGIEVMVLRIEVD